MRLEKGQRTIITDKKRTVLLRKAFDLMLTGSYTAQEVLNIINNDWNYTTRKKAKTGGGELARSVWYKMLSNPFYAGIITFNGKESKGKHKPIITMDEFDRIQEIVGLRGCKRRPKKHSFTYSECLGAGRAVTDNTWNIKQNTLSAIKLRLMIIIMHPGKKNPCKQGSVRKRNHGQYNEIEKLKCTIVFSTGFGLFGRTKRIEKTENKTLINKQSE